MYYSYKRKLRFHILKTFQEHLLKTNKEGVRSSALIGLLEDGNLLTTQDAGTLGIISNNISIRSIYGHNYCKEIKNDKDVLI